MSRSRVQFLPGPHMEGVNNAGINTHDVTDTISIATAVSTDTGKPMIELIMVDNLGVADVCVSIAVNANVVWQFNHMAKLVQQAYEATTGQPFNYDKIEEEDNDAMDEEFRVPFNQGLVKPSKDEV